MAVIHILKDGSIVKDISNRVIKRNDAGLLYQLIDEINRERSEKCIHSRREVKVC